MYKINFNYEKPIDNSKDHLWIIGDSFADPNFGSQPDNIRYWQYLTDLFNVKNFARTGIGPSTCFYFLSKELKSIPENTNLLFLMSSPNRIYFEFLHAPYAENLLFQGEKALIGDNGSLLPELLYLKSYQEFANNLMMNYVGTDPFKLNYYAYLMSIFTLRNKFKKTLVWDVFGNNNKFKGIDVSLFVDLISTDDKFQYITYPMAKICQENCDEMTFQLGSQPDIRNNHFGKKLNQYIGKEMVNYFTINNYKFNVNNVIKFNNGLQYPEF